MPQVICKCRKRVAMRSCWKCKKYLCNECIAEEEMDETVICQSCKRDIEEASKCPTR